MTLRRFALLVAAVLVGVAVGVPAAGAGANDAQAIRTAAINYKVATLNGSAKACPMLTPWGEKVLASFAWPDGLTRSASCAEAVKALAKLCESKFPNHQAYLRSGQVALKAIARGKIKIHGSQATLNYTVVGASSEAFLSIDFKFVDGRWLIDGADVLLGP